METGLLTVAFFIILGLLSIIYKQRIDNKNIKDDLIQSKEDKIFMKISLTHARERYMGIEEELKTIKEQYTKSKKGNIELLERIKHLKSLNENKDFELKYKNAKTAFLQKDNDKKLERIKELGEYNTNMVNENNKQKDLLKSVYSDLSTINELYNVAKKSNIKYLNKISYSQKKNAKQFDTIKELRNQIELSAKKLTK